MMRTLLADAILVLHVALVAFNVGALPLIWIGHFRGWKFVRNRRFRLIHLGLIVVVVAEAVLGVICPLTLWEERLRGPARAKYDEGFLAYWLHRLIFFDLPPVVFAVGYVSFLVLVLLTFLAVKPAPPKRTARECRRVDE